MQNEEGFKLLEELAKVIGGVVAGSRGAVEKGLVDYKRQVGQTGQTVSPKLYFCCRNLWCNSAYRWNTGS